MTTAAATTSGIDDLRTRIAAVQARFTELGLRAARAAADVAVVGMPPSERLLRKVCSECKERYEAEEATLVTHGYVGRGAGKVTLAKGRGCATCSQTGYKGRVAIYEIMPITREVKDLVLQSAPPVEITKVARDQGMRTLRESALQKVADGVTTLDEVLRVTAE